MKGMRIETTKEGDKSNGKSEEKNERKKIRRGGKMNSRGYEIR